MRRDDFNFFNDWHNEGFIRAVDAARAFSRTIVLANGVFDILHPGHLNVFLYANGGHEPWTCFRQPSFVIAALNTDRSAKIVKGNSRPYLPEQVRLRTVAALCNVDLAVLFDEPTPEELIAFIKPDVLVKGADVANIPPVGEAHCRCVFFAPEVPALHSSDLARAIHAAVAREDQVAD